jgi:hypothetical protein
MNKELAVTEEYPYKIRTLSNDLVPADWWINLLDFIDEEMEFESAGSEYDTDYSDRYLNEKLKSEYNATWVGMGYVGFKSEADASWFLLRFA